ncbi:hypothetical protein LPJ56_003845, partial [Coemansia sp. RSA 2599]
RDFLVKDAWPHAETRGKNDQRRERDEIEMLRTINETLGDDPDLEGKYPQLISAGVVRQFCGDDRQPMRDTTEHIYAMLDQQVTRDVPRRIHKRIAMRPLGLSIRNVRSVDELIVVAADIMKAHLAILRRCDILHRDLSPYNMLMTRDKDDMVHGLLVDFDCAAWASDEYAQPRANMTGTLPYMSIANLEELEIKRTSLDDWESMIYILSWLGTFGINDDDEEKADLDRALEIKEWAKGSARISAEKKRWHMTSSNFLYCIASRFLDGYSALFNLILLLRNALFDNPRMSPLARNARTDDIVQIELKWNNSTVDQETKGFLDEHMDKDILDPFARRAEFEKIISDDLWAVMAEAQRQALERIKRQKQNN